MFILMASVNGALMIQMRKLRNQYRSSRSFVEFPDMPYQREQKVLMISLLCFEMSYLVRFIMDEFILKRQVMSAFVRVTIWFVVTCFDGIPLFALLFYHYRNFKDDYASASDTVSFIDQDGNSALDGVTEVLDTLTDDNDNDNEDEYSEKSYRRKTSVFTG